MIQDATTQDELVEELSKTASLPRLENALSTETLQVAVAEGDDKYANLSPADDVFAQEDAEEVEEEED